MAGKSVLVIESDEAVREDVGRILARDGFKPSFVSAGDEISRALGMVKPDLVLVAPGEKVNLKLLEQAARQANPRAQVRLVPSFGELIAWSGVPYERLSRFLLGTVGMMLSLMDHKGFRGRFAADAARYCRLVASRLKFTPLEADTLELAAHFRHFLGILHRFRYGEETVGAEASAEILESLLTRLQSPYDVLPLLQPAPGPKAPAGARVLALVERFLELKRQDRPDQEIFAELRQAGGGDAGSEAAEALIKVVTDEALIDQVGGAAEEILVADSDPGFLTLLELRLANEGYRVLTANSGTEALKLAKAQPPSLVLADVALPGLDGFSLLLELKKTPALKEVPLVFASSRTDTLNMTRGLQLGAADYLPKPLNIDVLCTKLKLLLQQAAARRQAAAGAKEAEGVRGSLAQMGFVEMMNILAAGQKSALVKLVRAGDRREARLYLEQGNLLAVNVGDRSGEEAFHEVFAWEEGSFEILPPAESPPRNVDKPVDILLILASTRLDEERAGRSGQEADHKTKTFLDEFPD